MTSLSAHNTIDLPPGTGAWIAFQGAAALGVQGRPGTKRSEKGIEPDRAG